MAVPLRTGAQRRQLTMSSGQASRSSAPVFEVVPGRRRVARFMVFLMVLVCGVMIGAVLLHTRLAERQLEIDALERSVREEQEQFDVLRAQRAELRSPTRLAEAAAVIGMQPGLENQFVSVDPMVLAITIARTGEMPVDEHTELGTNQRLRPLDQFRLVKSVDAEAP